MTPIIDAYRAVILFEQLPPPAAVRDRGRWSRSLTLARRLGRRSTAPNSSSRRTSDVAAPAIIFDNVWKKFRRGERHDSLRD